MNDRLVAIQSLLLEALEIESAEERAAFLSKACRTDADLRMHVEMLIAAQSAAGQFLPDRPSPDAARAAWAGMAKAAACPNAQFQAPIKEEIGDWISCYRLLEKLGEGGCGVVYMAEQEKPVRRKVALKVIKLGMDTKSVVARFEAERQALALMDHPNIARVLDAGATQSGRPFFVMELVRGVRVTRYCDHEQLSIRQRLKLFIQVCEAVQHAHQKGIIHRDLKPSNKLVTVNDGVPVPKVIDFGIAKATSGRLTDNTFFTAFEQFLGTPAYMSPEQASMTSLDIDTRSDIYSLGVFLYELLTGKTPFDTQALLALGLDELRRTICEREPLRPSTRLTMELESLEPQGSLRISGKDHILERVKFIRGDLDWIVMKCLEKDRARRYETANGLARDIERHLANEPVVARPPNALYRWQKVIQRNRLAFAAGTAVALALVLGAVVSISMWQAARAEHERRQVQNKAVRQYVARGTELVNAGDLFGSLLWYAEALHLDQGDPRREEPHRIRIASVLRQCPKLINVFSGSAMNHSEFSPDGTEVLTTGEKSTAQLWDAATGKSLFEFTHDGGINDGWFSKNGLRIITSGQDKTARIWNARTGALLQSLRHSTPVMRARLNFDGTIAASVGEDKCVRLWNVATGMPCTEPLPHEAPAVQLAFSPDGKLLVTRIDNGALRIWDVAMGKCLFKRMDTANYANDLAVRFGPDTKQFCTCEDSKVRLWDCKTFHELPFSPPAQPEVMDAAFSPIGDAIVVAGLDATARVLEASSGKPLFALPVQHDGFITSARISPDGRCFITAGNDAVAKLWSTTTGRLEAPPFKTILHARFLDFAPDGRRLLIESCDQAARVWDLATSDLPEPSRPEIRSQHSMISPDGRFVLLQGESNTVWITDTRAGNRRVPLPHPNAVVYSGFGNDRRVITGAADQSWSWVSETATEVFVWDFLSGRKLNRAPIVLQRNRLIYAAISPDNTRLLACGFDFSARLWDIRTGVPHGRLMRHGQPVTWGAFSPDGQSIVTLSRDKKARVWDLSGQPLTPPLPHKSKLVQASWSQNAKWLYTLTEDDYLQVWDLATGEPLTLPRKVRAPREDTISESALPAAGNETLPFDNHSVDDLVRLSQMLAVGRIDQTGSLVPLQLDELTRDWELLRDRFPSQFSARQEEVAAWHLREARLSEAETNLTAALFHLNLASEFASQDQILAQERANLSAALSRGKRSSSHAVASRALLPPRNPKAGAAQIDLSTSYNLPLNGPGGLGYGEFRVGLQELGGTWFDVRGLVQLSGQTLKGLGSQCPERVNAIHIGLKCHRLYFLQACQHTPEGFEEKLIGRYVLHYADGGEAELPILNGKDTCDYWQGDTPLPVPKTADGAVPVWAGVNPSTQQEGTSFLYAYKSTRENPRPDSVLESIDFVSSMEAPGPFLMALTVE